MMNMPKEDTRSGYPIAPTEIQVRLAEQRRKLAIMRYHLNVRRGAAWFDPADKGKETTAPRKPRDRFQNHRMLD